MIPYHAQELPSFFKDLVQQGVLVNACSLRQLELFGQAFPGGEARGSAPIYPRIRPDLSSYSPTF